MIDFVELEEAEHLSEDFEDAVLDDERKRVVGLAISELPEDMQTVIHLVYFEGMTYKEVATVMKKNRKQIDNLLYRAKKELRIILGEDGEDLL